jgi:hypothetical protein
MDKKKLAAAVIAVVLTVAGSLLAFDLKGAVCGAPEAPAAAAK